MCNRARVLQPWKTSKITIRIGEFTLILIVMIDVIIKHMTTLMRGRELTEKKTLPPKSSSQLVKSKDKRVIRFRLRFALEML
jgi:hypothetical protein